jgi:hypothetical protein
MSLSVGNHVGSLLRRLARTGRQFSYFVRDNGETASCIACPRGFDCGIERQQVGLFGDALDARHYAGQFHQVLLDQLMLLLLSLAQLVFLMAGMDIRQRPRYPEGGTIVRSPGLPLRAKPAIFSGFPFESVGDIKRGFSRAVIEVCQENLEGALLVFRVQAGDPALEGVGGTRRRFRSRAAVGTGWTTRSRCSGRWGCRRLFPGPRGRH